jgi:nucleoid-associated protein YgaU
MDRKLPFTVGKTLAGVPYYLTGKLPNITVSESDQTYKAKAGERLDYISNKVYGKPIYWWVIAKANGITNGAFSLNEPQVLTIPKISLY